MKCPQILREKTLSQKYTVIALRIQWKLSAEGNAFRKCQQIILPLIIINAIIFRGPKFIIIQWHFFIKIRWHQEIDFAGNALKFERLKISSEIKGNFKSDGNFLKIALKLYSALRFERLTIIYFFRNQGQ